jgi:hypothetical protein
MRLVGDGVFVMVVAISIGAAPGCLDDSDLTSIEEQGLYVNGSTLHPNAGTGRVDIRCRSAPGSAGRSPVHRGR